MNDKTSNKWLILSDIHANTEALNAVLVKAKEIGYDHIACLGDLVGYGPNPNEVVEWAIAAKKAGAIFVTGNHDYHAANVNSFIGMFNILAADAIVRHRQMLTAENREFLRSLPETVEHENMQFVHGSPVVWDDYIRHEWDALAAMSEVIGNICFVGHTHKPHIWTDDSKNITIVNVGSVGQPRDNNPDACFVIFDQDTYNIKTYRVSYDIPRVQAKMRKLDLPETLCLRLAVGI